MEGYTSPFLFLISNSLKVSDQELKEEEEGRRDEEVRREYGASQPIL
jgi:hypothetical protein